MRAPFAAVLVFLVSAAVLTLEILAGRLLAPYVGVTLQTYTAVIGTVLAGIAVGSWAGGLAADRVNPRHFLGPIILGGGALSILTVPIVRTLGDVSTAHVNSASVLLAIAGFFLPALVLSAVTPMVVKLQLRDLGHTGGVVGALSGIGTFGALVGT
ncbi:MAG: fused MFS/spermidine synthase, partial [Thermoplasmata archaeon]|nr:fused MFS/spermidine synthase [Thermoplasmata archaeon]